MNPAIYQSNKTASDPAEFTPRMLEGVNVWVSAGNSIHLIHYVNKLVKKIIQAYQQFLKRQFKIKKL